jgi:site-specific DNA recombinase
MKYLIYCRKSTESEDRQVQSLDDQESYMLDVAQRNNLNVIGVYKESMSAKKVGRPVFAKVMGLIQSGKADAILCWKVDRLARNFIDGGLIMDLLERNILKEIRTHDNVHLPKDNVLVLSVYFGMATQYSKELGDNVKRAIEKKFDRGDYPGRAPFGYRNENKKIVVDTEKAPYVIRAFDLYANHNKSYKEISDMLYAEGLRTSSGKKVFKGSIQRMVSAKFYMGIMEKLGHCQIGNHVPLISKEVFDKAQQVAESKTRPRPQTLFFPLRGFLKCASCGCALTASLKKGHQYYYCTNGKGTCTEHKTYLRENTLYPIFAEILGNLAFSPKKIDLAYKALKERSESTDKYSKAVLDTLYKALESTTLKENRLLDISLEGQITKDVYDQKLLSLQNERILLKSQIKQQELVDTSATLEPVKKIFEQGITMRNEFLNASDEKKQEILKVVLWNLSLQSKEIVDIQYKSPYQLLAKSAKNLSLSEMLGCRDSNPNTQDQNLMSYH